ncbi:MAG: FG-GAP-like repeat-containing protein, partial [Ardenticatenaceae bacterium]
MNTRVGVSFLAFVLALFASLLLNGRIAWAGGLSVVMAQPTPRSLGAPINAPIMVEFDRAIDRSTITPASFAAFGRWSGPVGGEYTFADGDRTVILTPDEIFSAGEHVMVVLSSQVEGTDGTSLDAGYSFQFWVSSAGSDLGFETIDVLSTRTDPSQGTRSYGGVATDLDNDGWLDLSIVNEDSADVRVFLNRADGTGLFHDFIQPPFPVNDRASPSEASDFNGDGNADLAVVNIDTNSVSILLGQGDGTYGPQQEVTVGPAPRGIAVLDADADGDADIVNTNSEGAGSLSLLLNDGNGLFGSPAFFEGGGTGEWALGAADMNEDGILDLVVGAQSADSAILVVASNGDGTFTPLSTQEAGGSVWMLNAGDLNGDGHDDVATANSSSDSGSILLGDGNGNLAGPAVIPTDPFVLATDIGDIDGDDDLDWVTSSFSGDFVLFLNDGGANFTIWEQFPPSAAASCALMLDFDNDHDLDLALIDEIADEVTLVRNEGGMPTAATVTELYASSDTHFAPLRWAAITIGLVTLL